MNSLVGQCWLYGLIGSAAHLPHFPLIQQPEPKPSAYAYQRSQESMRLGLEQFQLPDLFHVLQTRWVRSGYHSGRDGSVVRAFFFVLVEDPGSVPSSHMVAHKCL